MKLSEAIRYGSTLRPETHQERFCRIENRDVLGSDVWGAACEAVDPKVAKLNWNFRDRFALSLSLEKLNAIQHRYFDNYFHMPASCPGATQRLMKGRGKFLDKEGHLLIQPGAKEFDLGGITSECDKVQQLAGFIDHAFYKHGWSREECAQAVEWYENHQASRIAVNFNHFLVN
jgi:hypothetical protein